MSRHKPLITGYLATNFDRFFSAFNEVLVQSDSYVTKRQSIKLLGEILLDRTNYNVMMAYVESGENLKLCMKLLRDDRRMVQYEAFHVFKVCLLFGSHFCKGLELTGIIGVGLRCQSEQVSGGATDPH